MKIKQLCSSVLLSMLAVPVCLASGLVSLTEDEMSAVEGQALFNLAYLAPGQAGNPTPAGDSIGFYTLSIEAEVALNANIKKLQLGCGGINGADGCDIDVDNFSFGCIANASGVCITLPPTGIQKIGTNNDNSVAGQRQMRDFVLSNPFYQFAIKNPNSASTREIVGIRIGAADVKGPLSFNSINSFSGYLTGRANIELRGQGPGRGNLPGDAGDVAVTCGPSTSPCSGTRPGNGQNTFGLDGERSLGLDNDEACVLFICAEFKDLTTSFTGVQRNNRPAAVNGNRETQAFISNLNLGKGTNGGEAGVVRAIVDTLQIERSNAGALLNPTIINLLIGLIQGQARDKITAQLAAGLGTSVASLDNDSYQLPYNLKNVHQLEVDSALFGITLSKQDLRYPGFVAPVTRGWAMYIPDGFTLDISDKTTTFVQNIASSSAARSGDIIGLPAPYRNCFGTLTFC